MNWEVRTMPSATLCSKGPNPWWNSTLYRKNLKRFWPIWGSYGVILLLVPLTFLLTWLDRNSALDINIVAMDLLGFVSPINFVYIVIIFLLLVKQFFMSIKISQLDSKVRILTQRIALNEEKAERDKLDL